ncbi:ATP/GTP-binding protein [Cutibacterium acnes JCM 18916]|nr:ATP/GTP-binding protein [Cutibacterium acnes JCM 18916]
MNDPTATKRESLTFMGQAVSLTARRNGLSFNMGDGHTVHCAATTPWSPSVEPGSPSPTCGYTYQQAAPAGGYKVTAITSWDVTWSVLGHTAQSTSRRPVGRCFRSASWSLLLHGDDS